MAHVIKTIKEKVNDFECKQYDSLSEVKQLLGLNLNAKKEQVCKLLEVFCRYEIIKGDKSKYSIIIYEKYDTEIIDSNIRLYNEKTYNIKNLKPNKVTHYDFNAIPHELYSKRGVYIIIHDDGRFYIGKADRESGFHGRQSDYQSLLNGAKGNHNRGYHLLKEGAKMHWLFIIDEFYTKMPKNEYSNEATGYNREITWCERMEMQLIQLFKKELGDLCVNDTSKEVKFERNVYIAAFHWKLMGIFNKEIFDKMLPNVEFNEELRYSYPIDDINEKVV